MAAAIQRSRAGRIVNYLFGRDALIGLASLMLLVISGYAAWHGMRDFIVGIGPSSASYGTGSLSTEVLVIAVVVALTFLMWLALRETFGSQRRLKERLITFPLYLFLAVWSVGFGYGFWWSLIAGEETTRTGLSGLQEDARDASTVVAARLESVRLQLDNVVGWSESQMAREEKSGGSCGTTSNAGRGPLYNARRNVRDSVGTMRDGMTKTWFAPIVAEVEQLRHSASGLSGITVGERQTSFETEASQIRGKARTIAARSNELGRSYAGEMRVLADAVSIAPGAAGFSCYDAMLAQRLRGAATEAEQPAQLQLREAVFNEGPAGVANAVKKLWQNIGFYVSSLGNRVLSGTASTDAKPAPAEPFTGRDLIALLAAIGVDLGLLALTALNPSASGPVRRHGLSAIQAKLNLPTVSATQALRSAIKTAVMAAPDVDLKWVRKHFIHHDGASYFVIPNLFSVDHDNTDEELRALAINQLAGVLVGLKLVRGLSPAMMKRLGKDEQRNSYSDLTPFRDRHEKSCLLISRSKAVPSPAVENAPMPMRNHGLLSKAQRALDIAGWSAAAQQDVEIFRLSDVEGMTPLLSLLTEEQLDPRTKSSEAAQVSTGVDGGELVVADDLAEVPLRIDPPRAGGKGLRVVPSGRGPAIAH